VIFHEWFADALQSLINMNFFNHFLCAKYVGFDLQFLLKLKKFYLGLGMDFIPSIMVMHECCDAFAIAYFVVANLHILSCLLDEFMIVSGCIQSARTGVIWCMKGTFNDIQFEMVHKNYYLVLLPPINGSCMKS
jgi:hypothetical protein